MPQMKTQELDAATMRSLYYGINPRRHAEKAYQPDDPSPPIHPRPTNVGRSGAIVVLVTTIDHVPPFGREAQFAIYDERDRALIQRGTVKTPGRAEISGLQPGQQVLISPETVGTMAKILTPEQIAGGRDAVDD